MELPIDHFRLLGVTASTDSQTVLRSLQQRLDRAPEAGFTHDALQARAELLRSSAELLSDDERRQAYERELTAIGQPPEQGSPAAMAALDIPPSKEVGGLILLMEAGQALEAFELACRGLQPPQAPALGSSREADLSLLAGLACEAAADDYRSQRRYETAARTLQQGLQLLQRMGQQQEQRQRLEQCLQALLPYRILDLISRDLSAADSRQAGIALLQQLVQQRGGLEGSEAGSLSQDDFQTFFKQIRQFLTVQEQVDLFSQWAEQGSPTADFLASLALTAAGFVQRKPERVRAGYERLKASGQPGVEVFLASQQLLLGQIDVAQELFDQGADPALRQWASEQGEEPLAGLCAYCRDWLSRDVLPGFRDIEADADLEAWFADRDVQTYVEQQDRIRGRQQPPANAPASESSEATELTWPSLFSESDDADTSSAEPADEDDASTSEAPLWPRLQLPALPAWSASLNRGWGLGIAVAVAGAAGLGWWLLKPKPPQGQPLTVQPMPARPATPQAPAAPPAPPQPSIPPLRSAEPSAAELQQLLERWLAAKAAVLAGKAPQQPLGSIARANLVNQLQRQQAELQSRGETELVQAAVQSFSIRERTPRRIAAEVSLRYSDERRDASGRQVAATASQSLSNTYVFARDGEVWILAAFQPSRS